jgi:subtilisin family serine protease
MLWENAVLPRFLGPMLLAVLAVALIMAGVGPAQRSSLAMLEQTSLPPAFRALLGAADAADWPTDALAADVAVAALVHLDLAPLGVLPLNTGPDAREHHQARLQSAQDRLAAQITARGGQVEARFQHAAAALGVRLPAHQVAAVRGLPNVVAVQPIADLELTQASSGAGALSQAALADLIGSNAVHTVGINGSGVEIAIVDSGIDYTHVKLGGPGTEAAYYRARCGGALLRPGDPSCDAGIDPPLDLFPNAKVRGGFDLIGDRWPEPDPACGPELVCLREDANPIDISGHGTAIADIVAGLPVTIAGDDTGVAPGANLWAFKACNGGAGLCNGTAVLLAIDHALDLDGSDRGRCRPINGATCSVYDPADIIVVPASFRYGQPEDALSFFAEVASFYGSLIVSAAGNDGDKPYVVGAPGVASAAIAVAESGFPPADAFSLRAGQQPLDARLQPWSVLEAGFTGSLRYGNGDGTNLSGCEPLPAWPGALLLDRNSCATVQKIANARAAGVGLVLIADTVSGTVPPVLPGEPTNLPVFSLTRAAADDLLAAPSADPVTLQLTVASPNAVEQLIGSSSRGPRIADGTIKPDLAAPGAVIAAIAGSGTGTGAFSGSSGSAGVVAGVAALIVQELERRNLIDPGPGLREQVEGALSIAPLVKAVVVNNADPQILTTADGLPVPFTAQGAGRVDARAAYNGRVIALDATEMIALLAQTPTPQGCPIRPYIDLLRFIFLQRPLPCAVELPFGNDLLQAWNGQAPNVSFGYQATVGSQEYQRQIALVNYSLTDRTYDLSTEFRDSTEAALGVSVTVEPAQITIPTNGLELITVTLALDPAALRDGALHNARADGSCAATGGAGCSDLTEFEVDGLLRIEGDIDRHQITIPWQVLPRRAAAVAVAAREPNQITLRNAALTKAGVAEVFALVDVSPNICDQRDLTNCPSVDYTPGIFPGSNESPLDLHLVGVRGVSEPGLNAQFGLPPGLPSALPDEVIEFALTVHDTPYRAVPGVPARFEISIDTDLDGTIDFLVYNADANGGSDGRSAVYVRDVNPSDGVTPERWYLLVDADFHTQRWILPVPAAAISVRSDQPFAFTVRVFDGYFGGEQWDCSPGVNRSCAGVHIFQTGLPKYAPNQATLTVDAESEAVLTYATQADGTIVSQGQIGLLFVFRDAVPGQEAAGVLIP